VELARQFGSLRYDTKQVELDDSGLQPRQQTSVVSEQLAKKVALEKKRQGEAAATPVQQASPSAPASHCSLDVWTE